MATLKEIFQDVSMMNPTVNYMSSIGEYVDSNAQQLADYVIREIVGYLPEDSLAMKIIRSTRGRFTDKQLWVVAYELQKNDEYCAQLDKTNAEIAQREAMKREARRIKRQKKAETKKAIAEKVEGCKDFQVGDTVYHNKFGEGTITGIDEKTITVNFNEAGEKRLLKAFAPIVKK
jgi:hypothetical protein